MAATFTDTVSEALLSQWREQGYVLLKQAIPRDQAAALLAAADTVIADYEAARPGASTEGSYIIARAIERTAGLDVLIDHPGTFPTIVGLMGGPYLQLLGTQISCVPPAAPTSTGTPTAVPHCSGSASPRTAWRWT